MGMAVRGRERSRRRTPCSVLLITTALTAVGYVGHARAQSQPSAQAAAQLDNFSIPPQSLTGALTLFGRQSGMQVSVDAGLVQGVSSPGVNGSMSSVQALDRLLGGTGITYQLTGSNTAMLEKLSADSSGTEINLPPVQVEGQAADLQSPYGPGVGYVATTSENATKSNAKLLETPQTVNVVTRKQIEDQAAQNVLQALRYTPGVTTELEGADNRMESSNLLVRGFTPDEYWNGLKLFSGNYLYPQVDPYMLDRIEVLKGPDSVLYGQANPGGLVILDSKLPTETPIHEIQLQGGIYNSIGGAFDFSGPLNQDHTLLYRLTGISYSDGTQVDHTKYQRISIAPSLSWKPDANTSFTLLMNYLYDPQGGFYNSSPEIGTLLPDPYGRVAASTYLGEPNYDRMQRHEFSIGYMFDHDFNDVWSVHQNFRYQWNGQNYRTVYEDGLQDDLQTIDRDLFTANTNINVAALDTHAQAKFETGPVKHTLTFGVDYQHQDLSEADGYNTDADAANSVASIDMFDPVYGAAIPPAYLDYDESIQSSQTGLYAQDQMRLGHWALLAGVRHDWASLRTTDNLAGTISNLDNQATTWRAGLVYLFDNGIAPYFSYSTSFNPDTNTYEDGTPFKPNTGQQYEAGVKYQPPGTNAFITASIYQITEQNVDTPDPADTFFEVQTGEIRARGIELSGQASPLPNLDVLASYTYMGIINTKYNAAVMDKDLAATPGQMASIWAKYSFDTTKLRGLFLGAGGRYIGSSFDGVAYDESTVPSVWLMDAMVSYDAGELSPRFAGWQLQLNSSNLFNKYYLASCDYGQCEIGLRRNIIGTIRYRW